MSVDDLPLVDELTKLKAGGVWCKNYTKYMIKNRLIQDGREAEIATAGLNVSLLCPLGQGRMEWPCRAFNCSHLRCFDASLYIQMNQKKPTWICPVCSKAAPLDSLMIDGYFKEILNGTKESCTDIEFLGDGSWRESQLACEPVNNDISNIDSETSLPGCVSAENFDESEVSFVAAFTKEKSNKVKAEELTLDSSSDEDEPQKKKFASASTFMQNCIDEYKLSDIFEFLNAFLRKKGLQPLSVPPENISVPRNGEDGNANSSKQPECVTID